MLFYLAQLFDPYQASTVYYIHSADTKQDNVLNEIVHHFVEHLTTDEFTKEQKQ